MPAEFFVDENDLALGKALDEQYGTVVYPGHPDLPAVPRGGLDDEWLPIVGQERLVVITPDQRTEPQSSRKVNHIANASSASLGVTGRRAM